MILGLLNITSHIWLLSLINLAVAILIGFKAVKNKDFQKYFVRRIDIVAIIIVLAIFTVMFFKDLYIYKGASASRRYRAFRPRSAVFMPDNKKVPA